MSPLLPLSKTRRSYPKRYQAGGSVDGAVDDDPEAVTAAAADAATLAQKQGKALAAAAPVQKVQGALWGAHGSAYSPAGDTNEGHVWNATAGGWSPAAR